MGKFAKSENVWEPQAPLEIGLLVGLGDTMEAAYAAFLARSRQDDEQCILEALKQSRRLNLQVAVLLYFGRRHFGPGPEWERWACELTKRERRTIYQYAGAAECVLRHSAHRRILVRLDLICLEALNQLTPVQMGYFIAQHPMAEEMKRDEILACVASLLNRAPRALPGTAAVQPELDFDAWLPERKPLGTAAKEWHGAQVFALRALTAIEQQPDPAVLADMETEFAVALAQVRALRGLAAPAAIDITHQAEG